MLQIQNTFTMDELNRDPLGKRKTSRDLSNGIKFSSQFHRHRLKNNGPSAPYVCKICKKTLVGPASLYVHMRKHCKQKVFSCHLCKKTFVRSDHLKRHVSRHIHPSNYTCSECSRSFKRADHLKFHKVNEHGSTISLRDIRSYSKTNSCGQKSNIRCEYCGKLFIDKKSLKVHTKLHTDGPRYECEYCGKTFNQSSNFNVHVRQHTGRKPYKCETCDESFSTSCKLKTHARKHTGELPLICEVCGKCFGEGHLLKLHMRIHEGKKTYICHHCGKSFMHGSTLRSHIRRHTGEKPYKCDICQESFAQISSLTYHKRTHTGEKPFVCDICGNKYTRRTSLNAHRSQHTGAKIFSCSHCYFKCDIATQLSKHVIQHHLNANISMVLESDKLASIDNTRNENHNGQHNQQENAPPLILKKSFCTHDGLCNEDCILDTLYNKTQNSLLHMSTTSSTGKQLSSSNVMNVFEPCTLTSENQCQSILYSPSSSTTSNLPSFHNGLISKTLTQNVTSHQLPSFEVPRVVKFSKNDGSTISLLDPSVVPALINMAFHSELPLHDNSLALSLNVDEYSPSVTTNTDCIAFSSTVDDVSNEIVNPKAQLSTASEVKNPTISENNGTMLEKNLDKRSDIVHTTASHPSECQRNLTSEPDYSSILHQTILSAVESDILPQRHSSSSCFNESRQELLEQGNLLTMPSSFHCQTEVNSDTSQQQEICTDISGRRDFCSPVQNESEKPSDKTGTNFDCKTSRHNSTLNQNEDGRQRKSYDKPREGFLSSSDLDMEKSDIRIKEESIVSLRFENDNSNPNLYDDSKEKFPSGKRYEHKKKTGVSTGDIKKEETCESCYVKDSPPLKTSKEISLDDTTQNECTKINTEDASDNSPFSKSNSAILGKVNAESHKCSVCRKDLSSANSLKNHMRIHSGEKPFKCLICGRQFSRKHHLTDHLATVHSKKKTKVIKCFKCSEKFADLKTLEEHCEILHGVRSAPPTNKSEKKQEEPVTYGCKICGKTFATLGILNSHKAMHAGEKPFECLLCGRAFTRKHHLKDHLAVHSSKSKALSCQQCNETFPDKEKLEEHFLNSHTACTAVPEDVNQNEQEKMKTSEPYFVRESPPPITSEEISVDENTQNNFTRVNSEDSMENSSSLKSVPAVLGKVHAEVHMCLICRKELSSASSLNNHMLVHSGEKPFKCLICGRPFSRKHHLTDHLATVHSKKKAKVIKCFKCSEKFADLKTLEEHCEILHGVRSAPLTNKEKKKQEEPVSYGCRNCGKTFATLSILNSHIAMHTGEKPFECLLCGRAFTRKQHLKDHLAVHSSKSKALSCQQCNEKFPDTKELEEHFLNLHTVGASIPAEVCEKEQEKLKQLECETCGKHFANVSSLNIHVRIHTGEKPFSCLMCGKAFARKHHLKDHFKALHLKSKEKKCYQCGGTFSDLNELERHFESTHTTDYDSLLEFIKKEPENLHENECDICGKILSNASSLANHVFVHTKEKPFKCLICGRSFSRKQHLSDHLTTVHSKSKEVKCFQCREEFHSLNELDEHVQSVHNTTLFPPKKEKEKSAKPECDICGKILCNKSSLSNHKLLHTGQKPFKCSVCGKEFFRKQHHKDHMSLHSNAKDLPCYYCNDEFSNLNKLEEHVQKAHNNDSPKDVNKTQKDRIIPAAYTCSLCGRTTVSVSALNSHMRVHTGERPFNCSVCGKAFSKKHHVKEHSFIHSKTKDAWCYLCSQDFSDRKELEEHFQAVHKSIPSYKMVRIRKRIKQMHPGICQICGQTFVNAGSLISHMRIHTGEKPFKCALCGRQFSRKHHLKDHLLIHEKSEELRCYHCIDKFSNLKELDKHIREVHYSAYPFKCNVCSYSSLGLMQLKEHVRMMHLETKSTCDVCGTTFKEPKLLTEHMKLHLDAKALSCYYCGESFALNCTLNLHVRRKHKGEKFFACGICSDAYLIAADLHRHMRVHTGDRPFSCGICKKDFIDSNLLRKHRKVHADEKPFRCTYCGRQFRYSNSLRAHIRIHTGARPYKCKECGVSFAQYSTLTSHKQTHNRQQWFTCHLCGKSYTRMSTLNVHLIRHNGGSRYSCKKCSYKCNKSESFKKHMKKCHPNK